MSDPVATFGRVTDPTALDDVTLGIAGVGAVTGLAALGATWAQFALSGPRLRVYGTTGYGGGPWLLGVTVENRGRMPVTIDQVSLEVKSGQHIPIGLELYHGRAMGPAIPVRLEPYSEVSWRLPARALWLGMQEHGHASIVLPFVKYNGKQVKAREHIDVANIASLQE